jgi:hypothetical protein
VGGIPYNANITLAKSMYLFGVPLVFVAKLGAPEGRQGIRADHRFAALFHHYHG